MSKKSINLINEVVNFMDIPQKRAKNIAVNVIIIGSALSVPIALILAVLGVVKKIIGF